MSDYRKIRVLVVDDHPVVRAGIGAIITYQDDMELVGAAATAAEAIELFAVNAPDVVVVDLSLPDRTGIELVTILRARQTQAKFLILTGCVGGGEIAKAIRAGAHAYLFKNAPPEELLTAIRTVSGGGRYLSPAVGRKADEMAIHPALTARELEVLRRLVRGDSNLQMAKAFVVTEDTIKFHVKNILNKLGVTSRSKAVALSLKIGIVQSDEM